MPVIKNPATCRKNLRRAGFRILLLVCLFCLPAIAGMAQDTAPLKEITVVSDDNYPPYIFRDPKGRLQGILVDEWRLWEEKTGIRADLRGMDWDKAQKTMAEGKAQVIDTIFFTEERARKLDYTAPYASIDVSIFFHKDIRGIKDVESLRGFTVGVKAGDAAIDFLASRGIDTLEEYPSYESIIRAARENKIKVFCIDDPPALHFLYKLNLERDYRQTAPLYTGRLHRAVPKGRKDILAIVEEGFAKISHREREEIENRWLGAPISSSRYLPYVFYFAGAFAVLGVVLLLWNHTLRRKVTLKTAQLSETIDSLRESEGRFRALFEQAAVGVAEIEMGTGRFLTVNQRFCEMVGRTREEMLATTFMAITHPEDLRLHEDKTELLKAGKIGHYSLEKRYLRKDGETVWVEITVSLLWKPGEMSGRTIVVVQDITDRKRMEEEMREMSLRDGLTDLYNRRGFTTLAEQQIRAANRAKRPMQITFIDCDGLKRINDILGHEEGDRSLIDTADILRQTFRESDVIARIGGDEFAVLSIDATDMNPATFSKRLQRNIDEFNAGGMRPFKLSMSWGATVYDPESPLSLDELMSAADGLMYAQKKAKMAAS